MDFDYARAGISEKQFKEILQNGKYFESQGNKAALKLNLSYEWLQNYQMNIGDFD